jgi:cytochrome d ubiquinol oxidase subunit II
VSVVTLVGLAMLASLIAYVLLGGADFGGGVWDLLARGPRKRQQRALVEDVISPVWEVNHIWLILLIVLLFTCFPRGFAAISTALHVPLTLMLIGIVLRGAAFAFRQYDDRRDEVQRRWGRVFAMASVATPVFLGVCLGAITAGGIRLQGDIVLGGFFMPWLSLFPWACGALTLALFAFLAATYLTNETEDRALQDDFRVRALWSGVVVGVLALVAGLSAGADARGFSGELFGSPWSAAHQVATGSTAIAALAALWTRRYQLARVAAILQATLIVSGWALAHHPYLVTPDLLLREAAAPRDTLVAVLVTLGVGSLLLLPALIWLMKVFRLRKREG